jgi:hypothetical protein
MKKIMIVLIPLLAFSGCLSIPFIKSAKVVNTDGLLMYGRADYVKYSTDDKKTGADVYVGAKYGNGMFELGAETDIVLLMDLNLYLKVKILDDDGWALAIAGFGNPRFVAQLYEYGGMALFSKSLGDFSICGSVGYSKVKNEYVFNKQIYDYGLNDFPGDVDFMNYIITLSLGDFSAAIMYKKHIRAAERSAFTGMTPDDPDTLLFTIGLDIPQFKKNTDDAGKDTKLQIPVNEN